MKICAYDELLIFIQQNAENLVNDEKGNLVKITIHLWSKEIILLSAVCFMVMLVNGCLLDAFRRPLARYSRLCPPSVRVARRTCNGKVAP